jgi:hypothetical protein
LRVPLTCGLEKLGAQPRKTVGDASKIDDHTSAACASSRPVGSKPQELRGARIVVGPVHMGQGIDNWTKTLSLAVTLPILPSHLAPQSRMFGNTDEELRSMNKQLKRMQA